MNKKILIICGPTNSGKTILGHLLAKKYHGEVINADSMQVYTEIPLITASPTLELKAKLPYHLYNFISTEQKFSVIEYIKYASDIIRQISKRRKLPIIVGGTGLYISTLLFGYNNVPSASVETRSWVHSYFNEVGIEKFWLSLINIDPSLKGKLNPRDKQRIIRAYEVYMTSGKSIVEFINIEKTLPLPEFEFKVIMLLPRRDFLYSLCNERIKYFFSDEVLNEVKNFKSNIDNNFSATKAIGIQEIQLYLDEKIDQTKSMNLIAAKTRQYAKRQITWFNNQFSKKIVINYSNQEEFYKQIANLKFELIWQ